MKKIIIGFAVLSSLSCYPQTNTINQEKIKEDFQEILHDISQNYTYLEEKSIDFDCLREYYSKEIDSIKTEEEVILFFEYLLDEFYDNHLTLQTNCNSSYRLFSPIYATIQNGRPIITNVWQSQIESLNHNFIGAEILAINRTDFEQVIENFPTHCNDKNDPKVREWITNKILAGRYNQPRILTVRLPDKKEIEINLDSINLKKDSSLLTVRTINNVGIIRINNSLGNDNLVREFDKAIDELMETSGLIIDLRNTVFGGDTYEARGIMSRFINEPKPYQKHSYLEVSENNIAIERSWVEYVTPRSQSYKNTVVVLVGRWTGSMGEGLAVGFEGMERAEIVGSEMRRLAGEVYDFQFKHQNYGYKLSTAKLFHINGTLRENYVPNNYVKQTTIFKDETLDKGIQLITKSCLQKDSILGKELELIGTEDQTLRLLLPEIIERFGRGSDEYNYVWSLIKYQDSICINKLIKIVDTHGWLGKSRVGAKANQAIWLVMQHAELRVQEKYLPLLKESFEKGESEGWHLAFFEDRILMYHKKEQVYGTQAVWDNDLKKNVIYPIADAKDVNQRRKEVGLEPIEEYVESNGYIFHQQK